MERKKRGGWHDSMQERWLQPGGFGASLWLRPSTAAPGAVQEGLSWEL